MSNLFSTLRTALQACYPAGEASAIARWVLAEAFGISQTDIYMGKDIQLSEKDEQKFENILHRLCNYEPVQYVLGYAWFCGKRFEVAPGVLIPRPETEELVELMVREHSVAPPRVLDIGTGSGCIPIMLAHHWPTSHVEGWDVSPEALAIAQRNNEAHGTGVLFSRHDILSSSSLPQDGGFDLIVSNPPYIKQCEREQMERNVLDWEPELALFVPDDDPLLFYRTIVRQAAGGLLNPGGTLYFEINREHGAETVALLENAGFVQVELLKDLSGNERIVKGCFAMSQKNNALILCRFNFFPYFCTHIS